MRQEIKSTLSDVLLVCICLAVLAAAVAVGTFVAFFLVEIAELVWSFADSLSWSS